jgi:hypothetical protein
MSLLLLPGQRAVLVASWMAASVRTFYDLSERLGVARRGRRIGILMASYTGYFDESRNENESMFVFCGLVLDSDDLQKFDAERQAAIAPLPFLPR